MKAKIILAIIGLPAIIFMFRHYIHLNEEVRNMKSAAMQLADSIRFQDHIESAEARYDGKSDTIILDFKLKDAYDELDAAKQFMILEYFHKQLRYYMRNSGSTSHIDHSKVRAIAKTDANDYYFTNVVPDNDVFTKSESTLYDNGEEVYTTSMFKQLRDQQLIHLPEDAQEKKILDYASYFYNLLTQSGENYRPKIDSHIIVDAVCKKFGITSEEYSKIYQRYLLGMLDASLVQ